MKKINIGIGFLLLLLGVSCAIIFEPDISNEKVFLLAPADSTRTPAQTHTFWWDRVTDAEGYNLLIVSPDFDSIVSLVADTNLTGDKFIGTLYPGVYQWGVSAYNYNSSTPYTVHSIIIDTSSSLTYQVVRLLSPENYNNTSVSKIRFQWEPIQLATSYQIDIRDSSWQGQSVINPTYTSNDTITMTLPEGKYVWGVKALNDNSATIQWSNFLLFVDATAPGRPTITTPQYNGDTLDTSPYTVEWTRPLNSISAISDSVIISSDSLFSAQHIEASEFTSGTSMQVTFLNDGKHFLKVRSIDAAGNRSESSYIRKFFIYREE
jgi:hypothetical protein